jgi:hypothetical protein
VAWDYNQGGPVGWWKMDECQGTTINDSSINGNVGTWSGTGSGSQTAVGTCTTSSTAWGNGATGKYNSSINFDGTDDYVEASDNAILDIGNNPFSLSAWVKKGSGSLDRYIIAKGVPNTSGYTLSLENANFIFFRAGTQLMSNQSLSYATAVYNVTALDTNWHHILATQNTTDMRIYIDGTLAAYRTVTDPGDKSSSQNFDIGRRVDNNSGFFNGQIDDVRVYNYALTATQVQNIYNGGRAVQFAPVTGTP